MATRKRRNPLADSRETIRQELEGEEWRESVPESTMPATEPTHEVTLPYGYMIPCYNEEEYQYCIQAAKPYVNAQEDIAEDYWTYIHMQIMNLLQLRRMQELLQHPDKLHAMDAKQYNALAGRIIALQRQIREQAQKLDPLKLRKKDIEGLSAADFLDAQREEALEYAKAHIGEFTWMCGHCGGINLMEVPHFAFDSAMGAGKAVWNREVFELVRHYYRPDDASVDEKYQGGLSVCDAARVLRVSPIGIMAIAFERGFDLGFEYDLNKPETLAPYVQPAGEQAQPRNSPG